MTGTVSNLDIEYAEAAGMCARREELLAVYAEIYADSLSDPFFSVPRYWERLEAYASRAGFSLVLGRLGGELVGYALGCVLPPNTGWWNGLRGDIPADVIAENGHRSEERATPLVEPDNVPARRAHLSWGRTKLADLQPFADAPVYEAMLLDLERAKR